MPEDFDEDDDEMPMPKPTKQKPNPEQEAMLVCSICTKMFKDKKMCPNCEVVLKPKGA